MNQVSTRGIILTRINYGEADRIVTFITPDNGKIRLIAKGVRKIRSKLAGGVELFSVSSISFIRGRGEIGTLVSARLDRHYYHIAEEIQRVQAGYELISMLHKTTEDLVDESYYHLMDTTLEALDDKMVPMNVTKMWFEAQLLKLNGHAPILDRDIHDQKLLPALSYDFNFTSMALSPTKNGILASSYIKYLRLLFGKSTPQLLSHIQDGQDIVKTLIPMVHTMLNTYIRV